MPVSAASLDDIAIASSWGKKPDTASVTTTVQLSTTVEVDSARGALTLCRIVAMTSITTSGTFTYDGTALQSGDVVLALGQGAASDRVPYVVRDGTWTVLSDDANDWRLMVAVDGRYSGRIWELSTPGPIDIGTTSLAWRPVQTGSVLVARALSNINVVLASPASSVGGITWANDDIIVLAGQISDAENGVYIARTSGWMRITVNADDWRLIYIKAGTFATKVFYLSTAGDPIVGTTDLGFGYLVDSTELSSHTGQVASTTNLGHVKIDGTTIAINGSNQIYATGPQGSGIVKHLAQWSAEDANVLDSSPLEIPEGVGFDSRVRLVDDLTGFPLLFIKNTQTGNTSSSAIKGQCDDSGSGVHGTTAGGNGLRGTATTGVGVLAECSGAGDALKVTQTGSGPLCEFQKSGSTKVDIANGGSLGILAGLRLGGWTVVTAATYTILSSDVVIVYDKSTAGKTLTLPAVSAGRQAVIVWDYPGNAGTNNITINAAGTDTFYGGGTSKTINAAGGVLLLGNDGSSKWYAMRIQ